MATSQEAVRRLTIQTSAPGADQAAASLRGVSKAMEGVTVASTSTEKASLSLDQKFASLERRYVSQVRAQQDYEKTQRQVNAAVAQNPALQERANVILLAAKERHDQLTNSQKSMATVSAELNSRMQAAAGSFGAVGSALAALGPAGLAAAAALGLVAVGFKQAADAALALADRAGKLKDFSETTGFTVVQLQALEKAGAQVGVAAESVNRGLERFSVAMDDIKKGTGAAYESILEINPALAQQMKGVNSLTDAWDIFSMAVKAADLEQANKLARSVFGRSGVEITRLARASTDAGGTAGLVAGLKEVDRITAAQAERWDELGDKIAENTKAAKQNIASIFTEQVLTAMLSFSNAFLDLSRVAKEFKLSSELKFLLGVMATVAGGPVAIGAKIGTYVRGGGASAAANDNPTTPPRRDFDDMFSDRSGGLNGSAGSLDTVRLEAQKRALSQVIAEQERWNAAMGAAVTPAQQLKLGIDKLKLAALENKISQEQSTRAQAALNAQYNSSQFSTYIGLLGQSASVEDQVQAKRNQINDATRQGVSLTKEQIATQIRLTQESALGITQINAQIDNEKVRAATMFMGAEAATAYAVAQSVINQHIQAGRKLSDDEIKQIKAKAAEYARLKVQTDLYADTMEDLKRGFEDVGKSMFTAFLSGKNVMDAMVQSLDRIAAKLADKAFSNILEGILSGNPIQAGIGVVQAGASAAISMFTGDQKANKELEEAKKAWEGMADQLLAFNRAASGFDLGPLTQELESLRQAHDTLAMAALEARDMQGLNQVHETLNRGISRIFSEWMDGVPVLGELSQKIQDMTNEARGLAEAIPDAAAAIDQGLIARINALKMAAEDALKSEINVASGFGWLNDINAAVAKFNDLNGKVDGSLLNTWMSVTLQKIVDDAKLTGEAFQRLITGIPQIAGYIHEYSEALDESGQAALAAAAAQEKATLQLRLLVAQTDQTTLSGALAVNALRQQMEMNDAIAANSQNIVLLEQVHAAERLNIVQDFADRATKAAQDAADKQAQILKDAQATFEGFVRNIRDFIAHYLAGPESGLSPADQLANAQAAFNSQIVLAQGGDRDALNSITQYFSDLDKASKAFYASSSAGQAITGSALAQLEALPSQISPEQFIVNAIEAAAVDQVTAIQAMQTALSGVLTVGNPSANAAALLPFFTALNTTVDAGLTLTELITGLGTTYNTGTLKNIFAELDGNGNGILEKSELIKIATQGTETGVDQVDINTDSLPGQATKIAGMETNLLALAQISNNTGGMANQLATIALLLGGSSTSVGEAARAMRLMMQAQNQSWGVSSGAVPTPIPTYAMGTSFHPGGMALIGERGPEILNLPRGSQVIPNHVAFPVNDNSSDNRELIAEIKRLNAKVDRLTAVNAAGHEGVIEAAHEGNNIARKGADARRLQRSRAA